MAIKLSIIGVIAFVVFILNFFIGGSHDLIDGILLFAMGQGIISFFIYLRCRSRALAADHGEVIEAEEIMAGEEFHNDFTRVPSGESQDYVSPCTLSRGPSSSKIKKIPD